MPCKSRGPRLWYATQLIAGAVVLFLAARSAGAQDAQYQTRESQCRHEPPGGEALSARSTDSGVRTRGYTAERVVTHSVAAGGLSGGDLVVCTEYGSVEIVESDDVYVRLQIRVEGFGEGSERPTEAAVRVIEETTVHSYITSSRGRLYVRVWHSTLGFTRPGAQPAFVSVRLQVPARGAYTIRTEAFHGLVAVRRLTISSVTMRGAVGDKFRGIPGFLHGTELDNVELAGDVDIDNVAGLPGIRAPSPPELLSLAAPILVKARVSANTRLRAVTGGDINIAIQPAPDLGVRALAESNSERVRVGIDGGVADDSSSNTNFRVRRTVSSASFESKRVKIEVHAMSGPGSVNVTSIPAAPLAPIRP